MSTCTFKVYAMAEAVCLGNRSTCLVLTIGRGENVVTRNDVKLLSLALSLTHSRSAHTHTHKRTHTHTGNVRGRVCRPLAYYSVTRYLPLSVLPVFRKRTQYGGRENVLSIVEAVSEIVVRLY